MATFEPTVVRKIIVNSIRGAGNGQEARDFEMSWKKDVRRASTSDVQDLTTSYALQVDNYVKMWENTNDSVQVRQQHEFTAAILVYVDYLYSLTRVHANSTKIRKEHIPDDIPVLGPRFLPPSPVLTAKYRSGVRNLSTAGFYLKAVTVVHPFYDSLAEDVGCPTCKNNGTVPSISWKSWARAGPRIVQGIDNTEFAIGYVMSCKTCTKQSTSTSYDYWKPIPHWKVPRK